MRLTPIQEVVAVGRHTEISTLKFAYFIDRHATKRASVSTEDMVNRMNMSVTIVNVR